MTNTIEKAKCFLFGHGYDVYYEIWQDPPFQETKCARRTVCPRCKKILKSEKASKVDWLQWKKTHERFAG